MAVELELISLSSDWMAGTSYALGELPRSVYMESKQMHPFFNLPSGVHLVPERSSHD